MIEFDLGYLIFGLDGAFYLATFDENDGRWTVSQEILNLEYVKTIFHDTK